jgi:hypothetical protein
VCSAARSEAFVRRVSETLPYMGGLLPGTAPACVEDGSGTTYETILCLVLRRGTPGSCMRGVLTRFTCRAVHEADS